MLINRRYVATDEELLYHYCSPETLLAICTGKSIRVSDLASMNDFMEMHWGHQIWEQAAAELTDEIDRELLNDIQEIISAMKTITTPCASCFSTDGDVLSQWRAYAADGTGYAVGFRAADLAQLPGQLLRVSYNEAEQLHELKALIYGIRDAEASEATKRGEDFERVCQTIAWDLAAFKSPAFSEEKEIRLLHVLGYEASNKTAKLIDSGGGAFGRSIAAMQVQFRMKGSTPVPYIDIGFSDDGKVAPIVEVVLGPKNDANLLSVSIFLESLGVPNVSVRKSRASYR